ncbi:MarR family winged helix-turn-helix transcriptional regulator [Falsigemmobacter faecalis]|uniref:MarR family transcriptional regulator n=1 Tax=Falsigemmobacter faecalis TaxID=2488730 RepID=A0A3P3D4M0_9RHOB|nr:MarR family transcriptional regulator [Falsigemmobacter faecalis]RRH69350.1 MarR family transcriptional regulator [Falsigemmobacter faecalis]
MTADVPLEGQFGMAIVASGKALRRSLSRRAAAFGLQDGEWGIIVHLQRLGEGVNQKQLARRIGNDAASVVRILGNMEQAGLVIRQPDPTDGRGRLVSLSPQGRELAAVLLADFDRWEADVFRDVPADLMRPMLACLNRLRDQLDLAEI